MLGDGSFKLFVDLLKVVVFLVAAVGNVFCIMFGLVDCGNVGGWYLLLAVAVVMVGVVRCVSVGAAFVGVGRCGCAFEIVWLLSVAVDAAAGLVAVEVFLCDIT